MELTKNSFLKSQVRGHVAGLTADDPGSTCVCERCRQGQSSVSWLGLRLLVLLASLCLKREYFCRAETRKEALAKAAEEMRESGKSASAFSESQYAVSEDKSPNVHTRQVNPFQLLPANLNLFILL